jgi:hypothetical protein
MERSTVIFFALSIFLVIGVSLTGCSDTGDQAPAETTAAVTTQAPLYIPGDIVRSVSGTESPAWLIIGYDASADTYTRALIYRNTDGSYGYRMNSATETSQRPMLEKVFTVKITHVTADSVPTSAPATATTAATETATMALTTTSASTTVTTSNARPSIKAMDPDEGEAGTRVVTEITGSDFLKDLAAELRHKGEDNIKATTVSWYSDKSVTCTFVIPNTTKVGPWDIVVTNPNGLSAEYTNYFTVRGNESGPI